MSEPIMIDQSRRLIVQPWENAQGTKLVTVAPQYKDRAGNWRLSHSGLVLAPEVVRELAPAMLALAAAIDGCPVDPMPTKEETRWP